MISKFWRVYLIAVSLLLGGIYFSTAQMSDVPLVLSDTEMEQMSGTLFDWDCIYADLCDTIPCTSSSLTSTKPGASSCTLCETLPNDTCYPESYHCITCTVRIYHNSCSGSYSEYSSRVTACQ